MAENKYDISGLNSKVENEGQTNQGKLSATEFNLLVNAAIESQEKIDEINSAVPLKKQITLTGQGNTVVTSGIITGIIPGHQYIVHILNPEASCSEITLASSSNRIYVSSIDEGDKEMTNFKLTFGEFPKEKNLPSYFYFVSNDTRICIEGVVNTGVELNLVLSDLGPVEAENFVDITDQVYTNSASGYVTINNFLKSSTSFYHSEPISLSKGDILKIYRCHNYNTTDVSIVSLVGDDNKYYSRVIVKNNDYSNSDGYEYYAIRDCSVVISFHFNSATNHRFIKVLKSSGNDLSNLYTDNKELNNYIEELYIPSFGSVHEVSDLDFYFSAQFPQDNIRYFIFLRDGGKVNSSDSNVSSYSSLCPQFSEIQRTAAVYNSGISTYIKFKENVKTFSNYRCSFSDRVLDLNKSSQIKNFLEEDMQYSPISSGYPEYLQSLKAYATTATRKLTASSTYEYSLYRFHKGVTYCFVRGGYPETATILAFKTTTDNFKVDGEINKFDVLYHAYFGHSVYYTPKEDEEIAILTKGGSSGTLPYLRYYPVEKIKASGLASVSDISRKIYLNKTERRYINTSTAKLGEVFDYSSMTGDDNYSFKIFNVNPGEKYELWIRGNTGAARTLLLDEEDKVIDIIPSEKKGFVINIPDNGKTLLVNSVIVNNSFGDPYVIRTKNIQSYIKNIEDNLGFVDVKVGSNATITDVKSVRTPFVPITSNIMGIKTNRPNKEGYVYRIGYSLTSSLQDIGSFETDAKIEGYIIRKIWSDTDDNLYADISSYPNAVGISFTIAEVDVNNPKDDSKRNVLRPKDFDGYYISIEDFTNLSSKGISYQIGEAYLYQVKDEGSSLIPQIMVQGNLITLIIPKQNILCTGYGHVVLDNSVNLELENLSTFNYVMVYVDVNTKSIGAIGVNSDTVFSDSTKYNLGIVQRTGGGVPFVFINSLYWKINDAIYSNSVNLTTLYTRIESFTNPYITTSLDSSKLVNNAIEFLNIYSPYREVTLQRFNYGDMPYSVTLFFWEGTNYELVRFNPEDAVISGTIYHWKNQYGELIVDFSKTNLSFGQTTKTDIFVKREAFTNPNSDTQDVGNFVLPEYLDCPVGMENTIFLDSIHTEPDNVTDNIYVMGGSSVVTTKKWIKKKFNSVEDPVVLNFTRHTNNMSTLYTGKTTLRPISRTSNESRVLNICVSGSSNIDGTAQAPELFRLLAEDSDVTVNQLGTRTAKVDGVTYRHEGRGGWKWETYLNPEYETTEYGGKTNAFMYNGKLDFTHYMQTYYPDLSGIDIFTMNLGSNDVTQGVDIATDVKIAKIIQNAKTFISSLLGEYPQCKFIVGLPSIGAPNQYCADRSSSIYKYSIQKLNTAYIEEFDKKKFHNNVIVCPFTIYMNRHSLFKHEDVVVDSVYSTPDDSYNKARVYTDVIHCTPEGYKCWGSGLYRTVRAVINGLYD